MHRRLGKNWLILILFITTALIVVPASISRGYTGGGIITVQDVKAVPGEKVELIISLEQNPGISAFLIYVHLHPAIIDAATLEAAASGTIQGGFSQEGTLLANTYGQDAVQVSWFNVRDVRTDGVLCNLPLTIPPGAPMGSYDIKLTYSQKNTINALEEKLTLQTVDGVIVIEGNGGETGSTDIKTPGRSNNPGNTSFTGDNVNAENNTDPSLPSITLETTPPVSAEQRFADVPAGHWAAEYIYELVARGIVSGRGNGIFAPNDRVSRAEFVKMLAGVAGADTDKLQTSAFDDIKAQDWFMPYVAWAAANAIVQGVGERAFAPQAQISREQMATMILRLARSMNIALPKSSLAKQFTDSASISSYAKEAVAAMQQAGLINGYEDGSFGPAKPATRAEAAKILAILLDILG